MRIEDVSKVNFISCEISSNIATSVSTIVINFCTASPLTLPLPQTVSNKGNLQCPHHILTLLLLFKGGGISVDGVCGDAHAAPVGCRLCSEGYEYGASRPAASGVRERMDIWGKDVR